MSLHFRTGMVTYVIALQNWDGDTCHCIQNWDGDTCQRITELGCWHMSLHYRTRMVTHAIALQNCDADTCHCITELGWWHISLHDRTRMVTYVIAFQNYPIIFQFIKRQMVILHWFCFDDKLQNLIFEFLGTTMKLVLWIYMYICKYICM